MTDDLKERLLPCPHCGGPAKLSYYNGGWPEACFSVVCEDWKCPGKTSSGSPEVAADAWNIRAPDPRITDLESRLAESQAAEEGALMMLTQTIVERDSERAHADMLAEALAVNGLTSATVKTDALAAHRNRRS